MAKSKNKRKNGKVKQYTPKVVEKKITAPKCKHCGADTRLASPAELAHFRAVDKSFEKMPFVYLPTCECHKTHKDWFDYENI